MTDLLCNGGSSRDVAAKVGTRQDQKYRFLTRMSETYAFLTDLTKNPHDGGFKKKKKKADDIWKLPAMAKLRAKELGIRLKIGLRCLRTKRNFGKRELYGANLYQAIDALVEAMETRLDLTENIIEHRLDIDQHLTKAFGLPAQTQYFSQHVPNRQVP